MLNPKINQNQLLPSEYKRYSRQIILENIGMYGQNRLKKAKILVIGAGGLGCPAIMYLAASGIGQIGVIDHDTIDYSNLNRQVLYDEDNISQFKSDIIKYKIQRQNNECDIKVYKIEFDENNASSIIQDYDIILDCTDNFTTRYIIDQQCFNLHKPHVYGGIEQFEGQISVFNYKNSIRYSDIYSQLDTKKIIDNTCQQLGVIGIITGVIGILQATEAIKIILGIGNITTDKILIYNLLNTSFKTIPLIKFPIRFVTNITTKPIYNKYISYKEFNLFNQYSKYQYIIIDVRENIEFQTKHLKYSINIPLNNLFYKKTKEFIKSYSQHKFIILYCNKITRSKTALTILRSINLNIFILYNANL
uniref:Probable molybdopterin-synthase adenylyltransferase n=1 Tax=Crouania attenuata TaxID=42002 RepID=A0A4D6WPV7_9FLOR|nr:Molybdopterin biosynthesis protein [Crouania attenuata]